MPEPLTPARLAVLRYIAQSIERDGAAPRIRDIARHINRTPPVAHELVGALVRTGWLIKERYRSRGLALAPGAVLPGSQVEQLERECRLLAMLAAREPLFDNPLHVYEAEKVRDKWLAMPAGEAVRS